MVLVIGALMKDGPPLGGSLDGFRFLHGGPLSRTKIQPRLHGSLWRVGGVDALLIPYDGMGHPALVVAALILVITARRHASPEVAACLATQSEAASIAADIASSSVDRACTPD